MESVATSLEWRGLVVRAGAASVTGKVRTLNEDSFLCAPGAYVVADGMGGHNAGDVASRLTIEAVEAWLARGVPDISAVPAVISLANDLVRSHGDEAGQHGMGSTLVGAFVVDNGDEESVVVLNVGDSRCYLLDGASLTQLTKDHSYVQELVDGGVLTPDEAHTHPQRNVVTRAIGIEPEVAGDFFVVPFEGSVRLMLCSDGVSGELDDRRMAEILTMERDPSTAAVRLTEAVLEGRAADNATAVVVDLAREADEPTDVDVEDTNPRGLSAPVAVPVEIDTVPGSAAMPPPVVVSHQDVIDEVPGGRDER